MLESHSQVVKHLTVTQTYFSIALNVFLHSVTFTNTVSCLASVSLSLSALLTFFISSMFYKVNTPRMFPSD